MLIADFSFGEALLTVIWIFLFVAWILFLIFIPFLTALIYLIVRGHGMRERSIKEQAEVRRHFDSYVRETAGATPVDELHKLNDLKEKGAISDEEFERMKAK